MTDFEFDVRLRDNGNPEISGIDTMVLSYRNPTANGATGTLTFDVVYGV